MFTLLLLGLLLLKESAVAAATSKLPTLELHTAEQLHRRRVQESTLTTTQQPDQSSTVYEGSTGTHYVDVYFGNPAQRQTLAVSTANAVSVTMCEERTTMIVDASDLDSNVESYRIPLSGNPPFAVAKSTTFSKLSCDNDGDGIEDFMACSVCDAKDRCVLSSQNSLAANNNTRTNNNTSGATRSRWEAYQVNDVAYVGGDDAYTDSTNPASGSSVGLGDYGFRMTFGCSTNMEGYYDYISRYANGILGMAASASSSSGGGESATSFIHQMYRANLLPSPVFSLCFHHQETNSNNRPPDARLQPLDSAESDQIKNAGLITLGGFDDAFHTVPMRYAKNSQHGNGVQNTPGLGFSYGVSIRAIYLMTGGGESVLIEPVSGIAIRKVNADMDLLNGNQSNNQTQTRGVVIDSSAPFTSFASDVGDALRQAWEDIMGEQPQKFIEQSDRVWLSDEDVLNLPTLLLQLEAFDPRSPPGPGTAGYLNLDADHPADLIVAFPPTRYMEYLLPPPRTTTASSIDEEPTSDTEPKNPLEENVNGNPNDQHEYRIRFSVNNSPQEYSVLGANLMRGHHILFDLEQWRIGFAEQSRCEREEGDTDTIDGANPDPDEEPPPIVSTGTEVTVNDNVNAPDIIYEEIDMEMVETTSTDDYTGLAPTELPTGGVMKVDVQAVSNDAPSPIRGQGTHDQHVGRIPDDNAEQVTTIRMMEYGPNYIVAILCSMFTVLFLVAKKACNGMILVYDNYADDKSWDLYVLKPKKRECVTDTNYNEV